MTLLNREEPNNQLAIYSILISTKMMIINHSKAEEQLKRTKIYKARDMVKLNYNINL